MKISIFIADDHQIVVDGLILLLKDDERFIISGYANNGAIAIEEINRLKPHIALLDIRMPEKDGLQVTRWIKEHNLPTKVILLSMHGDKRYVNDAKNFGADGYLLKNTDKRELVEALVGIAAGKTYFTRVEQADDKSGSTLTPRELDILQLLMNEHTSAQIAERLKLSTYTVETHRKNILKKTGAKNLAGLVRYALENKIEIQ